MNKPADERLVAALLEGDVEAARRALDEGADPCAKTAEDDLVRDYEVPALVLAAARGRCDLVELLLDRGAKLEDASVKYHAGIFTEEAMKTSGPTALWIAAERGHLGLVELLLRRGANAEAVNTNWEDGTPLFAAATRGHMDVVARFRELGVASGEAGARQLRKALEQAVFRGDDAIVGLLLDDGVALPEPGALKDALQNARRAGKEGGVRALLAARDPRYRLET